MKKNVKKSKVLNSLKEFDGLPGYTISRFKQNLITTRRDSYTISRFKQNQNTIIGLTQSADLNTNRINTQSKSKQPENKTSKTATTNMYSV